MAEFDALKSVGEAPNITGPSAGDFAKGFAAETVALGGSLAAGAKYFSELAGSDEGVKLSSAFQKIFSAGEDAINASQSEGAKRSLSTAITDPEFYEHPILNLGLRLTRMAPVTIASMVPGALVADAIMAGRAVAATGGLINAGMVLKDVNEKVDKLSDDELKAQIPYYAGLRADMSEEEARKELDLKRASWAPAANFVVGAALGLIGPAAAVVRATKGAPAVGGSAASTIASEVGKGALSEGAQEAFQDATTQAVDVNTESGLGKDFNVRQTVVAAIEGSALGGLLGGVGGGISALKKGGKRADSPAAEAPFTNKGMKITGPDAADANPPMVKPTIEDAVLGVQPTPQVKEGATGTPSKPVDDPAVVGNVQNAPVRGSRKGGKKTKPSQGDVTVGEVAATGPDAAQSVAIEVNKDAAPVPKVPEVAPVEPVAQDQSTGTDPRALEVGTEVTPQVTPDRPVDPVTLNQPEVTPQVNEAPQSLPPAAPEAFNAFAPVAEASPAPATSPRTGRVLPNLAQAAEAAANTKAQNEIIQRNIKSSQLVEPKGKNLASKDVDKIANTIKAAEELVAKYPPTADETNYTRDVAHRDNVVRRAQEIVTNAERDGIKIPTRIKPSVKGNLAGDSPHVQMLRYAADLARVAKTQAKGKKLTDAVVRFKEREDAYRSGASDEALAARRAEGEAARRADQGDVDTRAAPPENEAALSPEEILIRKQEEEGAEPLSEAPAPKPAPAAPPKKTFSPAVEKARAAAKALAEKRAAETPAASPVRKVALDPKLVAEILERNKKAAERDKAREGILAAEESALTRQDERARVMPERNPTVKQREAGNYRKGHVRVHGLDVTVETARGMLRKATDGSWQVRMPEHYGYIKRTTGADGDHVDAYVGRHKDSDRIFVIDQLDHRTGKFDEHKVMLNFKDEAEAAAQYEKAFNDGNGRARLGNIHEMNPAEFKEWLREGDTTKPVTTYAHTEIPSGELLLPINERGGQIAWCDSLREPELLADM